MRKIIISLAVVTLAILALPSTVKAGGCYYPRTASEITAGSPIKINFENNQLLPSVGYWSDLGVMFSSINGKAIYVNSYNRGGATTASGEYALFNDAIWPNTSANQPLKITFKNPTRQFGLYLGNGGADTYPLTASIKIFDKLGVEFCSMDIPVNSKNVDTFLGFETLLDFYSLTIDYGNTTIGEEIDDLMFSGVTTLVDKNLECNNYCKTNYNKEGVCNINEPGDMMGSKYCSGSTQCVCKANSCSTDSQCSAEGAHLKCLNNKCVYPSCNTACQEFYKYDYGSCGAADGNDVGSAYCGTTFQQCKCFNNNKAVCSDSDNGLNYDLKGTLNGILNDGKNTPAQVSDYCSNDTTYGTAENTGKYLSEYYCSTGGSGYYSRQWQVCPNGCENGACKVESIKMNSCTDTDGGENIYVKGKAYSAGMSYEDYCGVGGNYYEHQYLNEYVCNAGYSQPQIKTVLCKQGCKDGTCVDLHNNDVVYWVGVNNWPDVLDWNKTKSVVPGYVNMYTVALGADKRSFDVVGTQTVADTSGAGAKFIIKPDQMVFFEGFKTLTAANKGVELKRVDRSVNAPDKNFSRADGRLCQTNFFDINNVLKNSFDGSDQCSINRGTGFMDYEIDKLAKVNVDNNKVTCTDSDNFDMYVKGVAIGEKEGSRVYGEYTDSCSNQVGEKGLSSGKWLVEEHCSGPSDKPYVHTQWNGCTNGCVDGRCLKATDVPTTSSTVSPTIVCSDPDGTNIYKKSYSRGLNKVSNKPMNYVDHCATSLTDVFYAYSSDYVDEWVCKGDYMDNIISKCENGCVDGACRTQPEIIVTDPNQCYALSGNGFLGKNTNDPNVYYIDNSIKHWFATKEIYSSWYNDYSGIKVFPSNQTSFLANLPKGADVCLNGHEGDGDADLDTSDDTVNDCVGQTGYDGHYELCAGETFIHKATNIKLTNIRNNKSYIYLKLENSTKSTLVVNLGKSKEIYSKDWKKKVKITYETNSGDATGKIRIQTTAGYDSMFCGNVNYNDASFTTCLGNTITNYPSQIKIKVKDFNDDFVWLTVTGSNVSSVKIAKGQNILLNAKDNTFLQVGYENWAGGQQVNLNFKAIGMSCGNSAGGDGLYYSCVGDTIENTASGINAYINNFTDKLLVFMFTGASNYAGNTGVNLLKGSQLIVQNVNGTKLKYTYQSMSYTHGVAVKVETVQ